MASSMTTLTHVATVKKVEALVQIGTTVADATHGFTRVTLSVAADTSYESGFGEPPGGSDDMAGVALLTLLIPNDESVTMPAVGDTFNLVCN